MSDKIVRTLIGTKREETDLIGCPCCGEDVALAIDNYQGEWAATAYCDDCGLTARAEGASKDGAIRNLQNIWNTRYERTCTYEPSYEDPEIRIYRCSNCGCGMHYRTLYCPGCGAKVVDDERRVRTPHA